MNKSFKNQSGFTLIELCIVMIIFGLMVAGAVQAYTIYNEKQKIERMNTQMVNLDQAIQTFSAAEGRLPCPAPVNGSTAGNDYNAEDCSGAHGIHEVLGTGGERVLIGKYPASTLGLDTTNMKDVHGNYLIYAVTKRAAVDGGNVSGAIRVIEEGIDEDPNSATAGEIIVRNTHSNVQYVILSPGETGQGAWGYDGSFIESCADDAKENENCDFNDATFIASVQSDLNEDTFYDDRMVFKNKTAAAPLIPNLIRPAVEGDDYQKKGKAYVVGTYDREGKNGENSKNIVRQDFDIKKDGYLEFVLTTSRDKEGDRSQSPGDGSKIKIKSGDVISEVVGGRHGYLAINDEKIEFTKKGSIKEKNFELVDSSENFIYASPSSQTGVVSHFASSTRAHSSNAGTSRIFGMWVSGNE